MQATETALNDPIIMLLVFLFFYACGICTGWQMFGKSDRR